MVASRTTLESTRSGMLAARGRSMLRSGIPGSREGAVGRIQQCVRDVLCLAKKAASFDQAKLRIEQLFVLSEAQHRGHLAVAQRVRDQINRAYEDVTPNARPFLDRVLEWLDREHLQQSQRAD
jgi:hypothetical protein